MKNTIIGLTLILFLAAAPGKAFDTSKQQISWLSAATEEEIAAICLYTQNDSVAVHRTLLELLPDTRAVLMGTTYAKGGKMTTRFLADTDGWWIDLRFGFSFSGENVHDFLLKILDENAITGKQEVEISLRTSSGLEYSRKSLFSADKFTGLVEEFLQSAERSDFGEKVTAEIPDNSKDVIAALAQIYGHEKRQHSTCEESMDLIGFLWRGLEQRSEHEVHWPEREWTLEQRLGNIGEGLMTRFDEIEFTSRFQSVENVDVLRGERPQDLEKEGAF